MTDGVLPMKGQTVTGYGGAIPTVYLLRLKDGRTRRVKAMCYGNSASYYVHVGGQDALLSTTTLYRLWNKD
jgi:hypothetical protein